MSMSLADASMWMLQIQFPSFLKKRIMPSSYVPICHCRYAAVLSTPAVCVEEKLKVLSFFHKCHNLPFSEEI